MLKTIAVKSGGKTFDLALLSDEEAKAHEVVGSLVAQAQDGRWLAFKTTEPLPADAAGQRHRGTRRAICGRSR